MANSKNPTVLPGSLGWEVGIQVHMKPHLDHYTGTGSQAQVLVMHQRLFLTDSSFQLPESTHYYILLSILRVHIASHNIWIEVREPLAGVSSLPYHVGPRDWTQITELSGYEWSGIKSPSETILQELWCQGFSWIASFH